MRGKASERVLYRLLSRITPAYAGKSTFHAINRQIATGSPPPMRGKVTVNPDGSVTHGITPAYAGKSVYTYLILESCTGSPPPMRGKAFFRKTFFTGRRITPAYAGKRGGRLRRHCESEDHPRLCGEKKKPHHTVQKGLGSPPPMRGKDLLSSTEDRLIGITPAYAGKRNNVLGDVREVSGSPPPMRGKAFLIAL